MPDLDEQIKSVINPKAGQPTFVPRTPQLDVGDHDIESIVNPNSPKPTAKVDPISHVFDEMQSTVDYLGARFNRGNDGVLQGYVGSQVMQGRMPYEQAKGTAGRQALEAARNAKIDLYRKNMSPWDLRDWAGGAAETIPFMLETTKSSLIGAGAGGGIGAGVGAAAGFAVAGPVGAAIMTPVGAGAGAAIGLTGGAFKASSEIMAGQMYMDLRDKGISHLNATVSSTVAGAFMGALEVLQVGQIGHMGMQTLQSALKDGITRQLAVNAVTKSLTTLAWETTEEVGQEAVQASAESIVAHMENNSAMLANLTPDKVRDRLVETAVESAKAFTMLGTATHVGGTATGAALNVVGKMLDPKLQSTFQDRKPSLDTAVSAIIDATNKIAADEPLVQDVNPDALKASVEVNVQAEPDPATKKRADANKEVQALKDQLVSAVENDEPTADIRNALTKAKAEAATASDVAKIAEQEQAKAAIEKKLSKDNLSEDVRAAYEKDAATIEDKLKTAQLKMAQKQTKQRLSTNEKTQAKLEKRIADEVLIQREAVAADVADLRDQIKILKGKAEEQIANLEGRDTATNKKAVEAFNEAKAAVDGTKADMETVSKTLKSVQKRSKSLLGKAKLKQRAELIQRESELADLLDKAKAAHDIAVGRLEKAQVKLNEANKIAEEKAAANKAKIQAVKETTDAKISELQVKLQDRKAQADENPLIHKLTAEYNKISDENTQLKSMLELFDNPEVFNSQDVKDLNAKITSASAHSLVKATRGAIQRVAKQAVKAAVKNTQENKALVKRFIRLVGLNREHTDRLYKMADRVATDEQMAALVKKLDAEIKVMQETEAYDEAFNNLVKEMDKKIEDNHNGQTRGFIGMDAAERLKVYRELIRNQDKAAAIVNAAAELRLREAGAMDAVNDSEEPAIHQGYTSVDEVEAIARQVANIAEKSPEQINQIAADMKNIRETGRSEFLDKVAAKKLETETKVAQFVRSLQGNSPVDTENKSTKDMNLAKEARTLGHKLAPWNSLANMLGQFDKDNIAAKILNISVEKFQERKQLKANMDKLHDLITGDNTNPPGVATKAARKVFGIRAIDRLVQGGNRAAFKKSAQREYVTATGASMSLEKAGIDTRNKAIHLWNQMTDPDLEAGLKKGNKYTLKDDKVASGFTTYEVLDQVLTKEDKATAKAIKDFYRSFFNEINAWHIDTFGAPLDYNENYSGYAQRVGFDNVSTETDFLSQVYDLQRSIIPNSTKARQKSEKALAPADGYVTALQAINQFTHAMVWYAKENELRKVLTNPMVKAIIKDKLGSDFARSLDISFANIVGTRMQQYGMKIKMLDHIMSNMAEAFTSFRIWQIPRQMTSAIMYSQHIGPQAYGAALFRLMTNPARLLRTVQAIYGSDFMSTRDGDGLQDMMSRVNNQGRANAARDISFRAFLNLPTWLGDRGSAYLGGAALYDAVLEESGPEAANAVFSKVSDETQGSTSRDQQTVFELGGSLNKAAALFQKQNIQLLHAQLDAMKSAQARGLKGAAVAATMIAATHMAQFAYSFFNVIKGFSEGEDDNKLLERFAQAVRDAVNPFAGIPMLGDTFDAAMTLAPVVGTNDVFKLKERVYDSVAGYESAGSNAIKSLKMASKILKDPEGVSNKDIFGFWHAINRSLVLALPKKYGGGLPLDTFTTMLEDVVVTKQPKEVQQYFGDDTTEPMTVDYNNDPAEGEQQ